ncbi:MAG: ERF family protein [Terriglobales bacterium]
MNIYEKLAEARRIIRTTATAKAGNNSYSNYDYFTPEQVEQLVFNACEKTGTICITSLTKDEGGYYQRLDFVDIEEKDGGVHQSIRFELRTEKPDIKATNSTQQMGGMDTYSERYIKMKAFQIKDNNLDFDAHDNRQPAKPIARPFNPRKAEIKDISRDEAQHDAGKY